MLGMLKRIQHTQREVQKWKTARRSTTKPEQVPSLTDYWKSRYPRYHLAPHIQLMIQALEELGPDQGLIITMPPRHSKTETVKAWLEWTFGQLPESEVIYASYSIRLARTSSRSIRNEIATGLAFPNAFPHIGLAEDAQSVTDWALEQGGAFRATGVGGSITGMGIDLGVIDDPIKGRKEAESEVIRENVLNWFTADFLTRLAPGARVVLMHTRWHPEDLAGEVLKALNEDGSDQFGGLTWSHLNLPALAEANDPLGRAEGEPLWPKRFGLKKLLGMKAANEYDFESLYQQRPRKRGGQVFSDNPARYTQPTLDGARIVIFADTASSQRKTADFTAFTVLAGVGTGPTLIADVLEVQRARMNLAQLTETAKDLQGRYGMTIHLEETAQSQPIIQHLEMNGVQVRGVRPVGDKFTRSQPAATAWNAGRIRVPLEPPPWLPDLLTELASFTGTSADTHDDQVDALSYAWQDLLGYMSYEIDEGESYVMSSIR